MLWFVGNIVAGKQVRLHLGGMARQRYCLTKLSAKKVSLTCTVCDEKAVFFRLARHTSHRYGDISHKSGLWKDKSGLWKNKSGLSEDKSGTSAIWFKPWTKATSVIHLEVPWISAGSNDAEWLNDFSNGENTYISHFLPNMIVWPLRCKGVVMDFMIGYHVRNILLIIQVSQLAQLIGY